MKACTVCLIEKPSEAFGKERDTKTGLTGQCKACRSVKTKQYYIDNKEKIIEQGKKRYFLNKLKDPLFIRKQSLRVKFNLTLEQYDQLIQLQEHKCKICKQVKKLNVDHCHATGKVRGLLCRSCNLALGFLEDDESRIASAGDYIRFSK